jgi:biotin carboxyl carrier protein
MKYYVTVQGQEFEVQLVHTPEGELRARVDGQDIRVDLDEIEPERRYSVLLDEISHDVMVDLDPRRLHLQVGGHRLDARVEDERERMARRIGASMPRGPATVIATMPGILRGVLVKSGDPVEEGQALVILEAMKMENEIAAEQPGVVREVKVAVGETVESGAPLLILDPPPPEAGEPAEDQA